MDTAKMIAVGLGDDDFTVERHVRDGGPAPERRCGLICVPTTAGTGSEVTPFATVWDGSVKASVSGESVYADAAVLDPSLTIGMPGPVTVATGLDALTQAFEALWGRRRTPVTDALAIRAVGIGIETLGAVVQAPADLRLRSAMVEVSLLAGLAISHTRTALCHSISYPLTGHYGVPHGLACAMVLPEVFEFNRVAEPTYFDELAEAVGAGRSDALSDGLVRLLDELNVGGLLAPYLAGRPHPARYAGEMLTPGRADNNIRPAAVEDVRQLVDAAMLRWGLSTDRADQI